MLLFRRIDNTRWFGKKYWESLSVTELSTKDNELSVWMDDKKVKAIDLALAYALTQGNIKEVWCVKIPKERLDACGLQLRQENSTTCYKRMQSYHTNILVPTLIELGDLAGIIHNLVQEPEVNCCFFTETDLKNRFYEMVKHDFIEIDFNDKKNQQKWQIIEEREKSLGKIDFGQLTNVKPREKKK